MSLVLWRRKKTRRLSEWAGCFNASGLHFCAGRGVCPGKQGRNPHPNPLPEYRARGKEGRNQIRKAAPSRFPNSALAARMVRANRIMTQTPKALAMYRPSPRRWASSTIAFVMGK